MSSGGPSSRRLSQPPQRPEALRKQPMGTDSSCSGSPTGPSSSTPRRLAKGCMSFAAMTPQAEDSSIELRSVIISRGRGREEEMPLSTSISFWGRGIAPGALPMSLADWGGAEVKFATSDAGREPFYVFRFQLALNGKPFELRIQARRLEERLREWPVWRVGGTPSE